MTKVLVDTAKLTSIADAIREKTGTTEKMKPAEMAPKIQAIQTNGGVDNFDTFLESATIGPLTINAESIRDGAFYLDSDAPTISFNLKCPKLKTVGVSAFRNGSLQKVVSFDEFTAPLLETVNNRSFYGAFFKKYDFSSLKNIGDYAFSSYNTVSLTNDDVFVLEKAERIGSSAFENRKLKNVVIGENTTVGAVFEASSFINSTIEVLVCNNVSKINMMAFYRSKLSTLVIKGTTVAQLASTSAFDSTPIASGTGNIYVEDNLVEEYKKATNWAVFIDQIKPLSEYTEVSL